MTPRAVPPAQTPDDITLGEVYRGLLNLQAETNRRFDDLAQVLSSRVVSTELYQVSHQALELRVLNLENETQRVAASRRALIVAVVGSLVATIGNFVVVLVRLK